MKFFISVILFLLSADAQEIAIDGAAAERYQNKELNELAGFFGCGYDCTYKPLNVAQLAVCTAADHLGDKMNLLFKCGIEEPRTCSETKESMVPGADNCVPVQIPQSWIAPLGQSYLCLPTIIANDKVAFLGALSAFKPLFESFQKLTPPTTIPHLMECLTQSNTEARLCAAVRGGDRCAPCDGIPAKYYPTTTTVTITRLCLPTSIKNIACTLLKEPTADRERPYCPLRDPEVNLPKACKPDDCPPPEACSATGQSTN